MAPAPSSRRGNSLSSSGPVQTRSSYCIRLDPDNLVIARRPPPMATIEPVVRLELQREQALGPSGPTSGHLIVADHSCASSSWG